MEEQAAMITDDTMDQIMFYIVFNNNKRRDQNITGQDCVYN